MTFFRIYDTNAGLAHFEGSYPTVEACLRAFLAEVVKSDDYEPEIIIVEVRFVTQSDGSKVEEHITRWTVNDWPLSELT